MSLRPCPACDGARLRPESRAVLVAGTRIEDFCALSARRALEWLEEVELSETDRHVARLILREISERLQFLENVGIGYLSMDRAAATLSGRRGAAHPPRDADRLLAGRRALHPRRAVDRPAPARQLEADRDARAPARPRQHGDRRRARRADDARRRPPRRPRPGAGEHGGCDRRAGHRRGGAAGQGVADRPVPLRGTHDRGARARRRTPTGYIEILGATQHNLRDIDVHVPARGADLRDGRLGLGQVDARQRRALQGGCRRACTAHASAPEPTVR